MSRKKQKKIQRDDTEAVIKILCEEAKLLMKMRNYVKALDTYNKVR